MASPTKKTRKIRKSKARSAGRERKNKMNNNGTTRSMEELFETYN